MMQILFCCIVPSPSFPPPLALGIFLARLKAVAAAAVDIALIGDDAVFRLKSSSKLTLVRNLLGLILSSYSYQ